MSSKVKVLKYKKVINIDKYEILSKSDKIRYLIEKNIFIKTDEIDNFDDEDFTFTTEFPIVIDKYKHVINPSVCSEFFELIFDRISEEGNQYLKSFKRIINHKLLLFDNKKDKQDYLSLKISELSKYLKTSFDENLFNDKLKWKKYFIANFKNELFNYLVNGPDFILNEIELNFCAHNDQTDEVSDKFDLLTGDAKIEFLKQKYEELTFFEEGHPGYDYYKDLENNMGYDDEISTLSSHYSEDELAEKYEEVISRKRKEVYDDIVNYYTEEIEFIIGYPLSAYRSLYTKSDLIEEWINLFKAKTIIPYCYELINKIEKSAEKQLAFIENEKKVKVSSIFNSEIYEELFINILNEMDALTPEGKAKKRNFQTVCDAFFRIHKDLRDQIFKYSTTKRAFIEYLNTRFDAKIKDTSKLSNGIKHISSVEKEVISLLKEIKESKTYLAHF